MRLARLVVLRRPPLQAMGERAGVQIGGRLPCRDLFHEVQKRAAIPVRHGQQAVPCLGRQRQLSPNDILGPVQKCRQFILRKAFEHQNLRPRQKCRVQLEGRVFGGRAHQQDRPVLHMRQEPVLLRLVEAVDLVDEQQRPLAIRMSVPGRLEHFPKLGHAGEDRADLDEVQIRLGGEKPGDGGLAHPPVAPRRSATAATPHPASRAGCPPARADGPAR